MKTAAVSEVSPGTKKRPWHPETIMVKMVKASAGRRGFLSNVPLYACYSGPSRDMKDSQECCAISRGTKGWDRAHTHWLIISVTLETKSNTVTQIRLSDLQWERGLVRAFLFKIYQKNTFYRICKKYLTVKQVGKKTDTNYQQLPLFLHLSSWDFIACEKEPCSFLLTLNTIIKSRCFTILGF